MSKDAWNRYGSSGSWRYEINDAGFKYNLPDVLAAIGLAQLRRADDLKARRTAIAEFYNRAFADEECLQIPQPCSGADHAWHRYVLRLRPERLTVGRDQFLEALKELGIGCSVHCIPLHLMSYYQKRFGYRAGDFPIAENVFLSCLSLPLFPDMTASEREYVVEAVLSLVRQFRR